ncbi:hypothetical protein [Magnetospirillum moscoviense]|uniref:Uncharacterized protein n=1 Tax=Magnetospirillum moscoviense TaxID=1437059 RepID=A0A178MMA7_9PROT|nr:hypothetical protein [Magnetospirillum moscoviense]OAN49890.1 hypothetical protein A6A05_12760 [Magnetospirillum moscoviense]
MADKGKPAAKPVDKDAAQRKEIIRTIKGPVTDRLLELIPAFAAYEDPYGTILATPDLLFACLTLVKTRRDKFQEFLVDAAGNPVMDDQTPLRCDRSVDQIVGMVVRSATKAYSDKRWGSAHTPAAKIVHKPETRSILDKLGELVRGKWSEAEVPKPSATQGDKFYAAIKDHLDYDWQVPLIPYFAEIPIKLINELGRGVTTLRTPEGIAALADIGRHSMDSARKILSDDMMREMLDTQPLAAKGVAFLGKERYEFLHGAIYERIGDKFWEVCVDCDRLEAMEVQNAKDLEQMSAWLHLISGETINQIVRFLQFHQIPVFLEVALDKLGEETFKNIFGPPGNKKLIKMFCEKTSKTPLDPNDPIEDLKRRLPDVFGAYLRAPGDFEKGL